MGGWLTFLTYLAVLAAGVEFLLLRFLLRLGPLLPETDVVTSILLWGNGLGTWALNVAVVAGLLALGALIVGPDGNKRGLPLKGATALALALSLLGLAVPLVASRLLNPAFLVFISGLSIVFVLSVGFSLWRCRPARLLSLLLAGLYVAGFYHYLSRGAAFLGVALPGGGAALLLAEGLILLVAPALLLIYRPGWRRWPAAAATVTTLLYGVAVVLRPWVVSALATWDFALTNYLPSFLYGAALWAFVYTVAVLLTTPRSGVQAGVGLAFMALGGLRLDNTYFSLLAFLGLLLTARAIGEMIAAREMSRAPRRAVVSPTPSAS